MKTKTQEGKKYYTVLDIEGRDLKIFSIEAQAGRFAKKIKTVLIYPFKNIFQVEEFADKLFYDGRLEYQNYSKIKKGVRLL